VKKLLEEYTKRLQSMQAQPSNPFQFFPIRSDEFFGPRWRDDVFNQGLE
jgi:hypothetical protein